MACPHRSGSGAAGPTSGASAEHLHLCALALRASLPFAKSASWMTRCFQRTSATSLQARNAVHMPCWHCGSQALSSTFFLHESDMPNMALPHASSSGGAGRTASGTSTEHLHLWL
eukprot:CAMPEP_0198544802 /NCGR_PEP_ID=MMETSP1462-20131121/61951_1 /TAXON_ID=1333877 /ORGANISM="Brandtodinium nutriculum, Strain RCC3387" /LENGTH=114 /DNA_ID=CAMNT_0044275151 /DNA_START=327 /DNA_END=671 /DNA_ORIENTATION=-